MHVGFIDHPIELMSVHGPLSLWVSLWAGLATRQPLGPSPRWDDTDNGWTLCRAVVLSYITLYQSDQSRHANRNYSGRLNSLTNSCSSSITPINLPRRSCCHTEELLLLTPLRKLQLCSYLTDGDTFFTPQHQCREFSIRLCDWMFIQQACSFLTKTSSQQPYLDC